MNEKPIKFEDELRQIAEGAILKIISEGSWIQPDYNNRIKVPADFMNEVWALVDKDAIKKQFAKRIESELADRLVNHIAAEMATDIKQILSVQERREAVRSIARQHLDSIIRLGVNTA